MQDLQSKRGRERADNEQPTVDFDKIDGEVSVKRSRGEAGRSIR
jgi:hypothetical protein